VTAYDLGLDGESWMALGRTLFGGVRELDSRDVLVGFGAAWLAFSGLESISQLAPVIRQPLRRTAKMSMVSVIVTILITSPTLTVMSVGVLPGVVEQVESERLISQLAFVKGGEPLGLAVVLTAASLLLFAANTAIIGAYHVFLALSERRYFPNRLHKRHPRFNTPHKAIVFATVVPLLVIMLTRGRLGTLGDMYAFGLLGAFIIESGGLDRLRWRDGQRGPRFWIGVLPTTMVVVAWLVNIVEKPTATFFGGGFAALGMLWGLGLRTGLIKDVVHTRFTTLEKVKRDVEIVEAGEKGASEIEHAIVSLGEAKDITHIVKSSTLVAVSGVNADVVAEGLRRVRGMGESALYCIYVEEWPGLFGSEEGVLPGKDGVLALTSAAAQAAAQEVELVPIWTASYSAAVGIATAAEDLGVEGVIIGAPRRSALDHVLRGQVLKKLTKLLPENCRLVICD
jgi:nucleotide-binding universal stress UspA family protein